MTTHELARKLLEGPDVMATVRGYEGGVDEITSIDEPQTLFLNANDAWYYGAHEYKSSYTESENKETVLAIHIGA